MPPPTTVAGQLVLNECTALYRALNYRIGDFKALVDLRKNYAEIARQRSQVVAASQGLERLKTSTKENSDLYRSLNKRANELGKTANESKRLWDRLLSKVPGGNSLSKVTKIGGLLAALFAIGIVAALQKIQQDLNNLNIDNIDRLITELGKTATLAINNKIEIKGLQEREKITKTKINDITYEVRQGRKIVEEKVDAAKKEANDALYETREGRKKLETQINEQNSNFRSLKADFDKALKNINTGFQSQVTKTITEIQSNLKSADNQIKSANEKISIQGKIISELQSGFKTVQNLPKTLDTKISELKDFTIKLVNGKLQPVEAEQRKIAQQVATVQQSGITRKDIEATNASLRKTYEQSFEFKAQQWQQEIQKQNNDFWNKKTEVTLSSNTKITQSNTEKITQLERDNAKIKTDLDKIDKQVKDQTKVNQEAIPKLNQIINFLPLIPARVADNIRPSIPTIPQIENAAATGMCKTTQPGGCSRKMMDDAVGNINGNTNNKTGDVLNAVNAGLQIPELALLDTINNKLGNQIPGGIGRVVSQITRNQAINQIVNLVTMAAAIHNAIQLSDNVAVTFFGILDNLFAIPTLIINPEGNPIDTRDVFNNAIENVMKSVFGVEEWAEIKARWAAFNRIYQAAANSVNEIRSIGSSLNDAISTTATLTGRGFNALQNDGILSDYNWEPTPENLRLKGGIYAKLGKLADGINVVGETLEAIESVTSEIRSAVESANQIKSNTAEMEAEIKKLLGDETKKKDEEIAALQVPTFNYEDLL
ncbi:hypothetical protein BCD64_23270 [Nostoc sp. MBR 210]|nr:hypothetical protein BCD64_23270 [Nostoc sp. MBR 210]